MYNRHHETMPYMFYSLFTVNRDITGHDTRQCNLLRVPKVSSVYTVEQFYSVGYHFTFLRQQDKSWCIYLILQMQFEEMSKLVLLTSQIFIFLIDILT